MSESLQKKKERALRVVLSLKEIYPEGICSLNYDVHHELLFAVRMSAQCTDARVNMVTPELFGTYPSLEALANAEIPDIERIIHSTGFYRAKARDIVLASQMMLRDFDGKVPDTMENLLKLPGIGRKTANLILGDVYNVPGVVVADTHCMRITGRLGFTMAGRNPDKVEQDLRKVLPPEESNNFCHRLVLHGRDICKPDGKGGPLCEDCVVAMECHFALGIPT